MLSGKGGEIDLSRLIQYAKWQVLRDCERLHVTELSIFANLYCSVVVISSGVAEYRQLLEDEELVQGRSGPCRVFSASSTMECERQLFSPQVLHTPKNIVVCVRSSVVQSRV